MYSCWVAMLDNVTFKHAEGSLKWWFHVYRLIQTFLAKSGGDNHTPKPSSGTEDENTDTETNPRDWRWNWRTRWRRGRRDDDPGNRRYPAEADRGRQSRRVYRQAWDAPCVPFSDRCLNAFNGRDIRLVESVVLKGLGNFVSDSETKSWIQLMLQW